MSDTTADLQRLIDALGEPSAAEFARADLIARAEARLCARAAAMLYRSFPRLARPPAQLDPSELVNRAAARLLQALQGIQPRTVAEFFALANKHIRWELLELARELERRHAALPDPEAQPAPDGSSHTPPALWVRLHEAIDRLPDEDQELMDWLVTQGLTHQEAADLRQVSVKTVQRDWRRIRLALAEALGQDLAPLLA
jgi:RNA polymerase sigma-70 factor (ECF subfamily)